MLFLFPGLMWVWVSLYVRSDFTYCQIKRSDWWIFVVGKLQFSHENLICSIKMFYFNSCWTIPALDAFRQFLRTTIPMKIRSISTWLRSIDCVRSAIGFQANANRRFPFLAYSVQSLLISTTGTVSGWQQATTLSREPFVKTNWSDEEFASIKLSVKRFISTLPCPEAVATTSLKVRARKIVNNFTEDKNLHISCVSTTILESRHAKINKN